jgi:small GTP-binding protein
MSFFKVLVIGDVATGKTALVNRLVNDTFTDKYKATLGCEFGLKSIEVAGKTIRVQLWDLAGQDRLGGISRLYCRDANGAIVVSDVTDERTVERALNWKAQVDEHVRMSDGSHIPMVFCLNKYDLVPPGMTQADLQRTTTDIGFTAGFFTSAKTGLNAESALKRLVEEVFSRVQPNFDNEEVTSIKTQRLIAVSIQVTKKAKCC